MKKEGKKGSKPSALLLEAIKTKRTPKGITVVDNSILSEYRKCPTAAAGRYGLGWTGKGEKAHLLAGSAVHAALQAYENAVLDGKSLGAAVGIGTRAFRDAYQAWCEAAWKRGEIAKSDRLWWETVERILLGWWKVNPMSEWPVQPFRHREYGEIIERAIVQEWGKIEGEEVWMVGLMDFLGMKKSGGGVWICDHKTGKSITQWWRDRQQHSYQYTGYAVLAEEALGVEIDGVVANGIELGELNSSDRKCSKHGMAYRDCALSHLRHEWLFMGRSAWEKDLWRRDAKEVAQEWIGVKQWIGKQKDPIKAVAQLPADGKWTGACANCELKDWCDGGRKTSPSAIRELFAVQRWDPLAREGIVEGKGGEES